MGKTPYGYGAYRGRGGSPILKIIIAILLVVLVVALAAFFYLPRYMVYPDDGPAYLDLPFLRGEEQTEPTPPPVVVTPTPTPTPEPSRRPETILPVALPPEALYDGTAAEQVTELGGNAALFDMKLDTGELGWVSSQDMAIQAQASADTPALNAAIQLEAEREREVYRIARVACFRDDLLGKDGNYAILTNSGYRWMDWENIRWTSPTNPQVRTYLAQLCVELSELGFDEIVLDYAAYPTRGHLNYIRIGEAYDVEQFETVITAFYQEVVQALEGTETALAVVYDGETTALSGQSAQVLEELNIAAVTRREDGSLAWPAGGQRED